MNILDSKPQWFWAGLVGVALLGVFFGSSGTWPQNQYYVYAVVGLLFVASSNSGELQKINTGEADKIAMSEMKRRQTRRDEDVPTGQLKIIPEMKINDEGGSQNSRIVAIKAIKDDRKTFLVEIPLFKDKYGRADIISVTHKDEWSITDRPNIIILKPDTTGEFVRLNEQVRKRTLQEAEAV